MATKTPATTPPKRVHVRRVIEVVTERGTGTAADPVQEVRQLYSFHGELLAEHVGSPAAAISVEVVND